MVYGKRCKGKKSNWKHKEQEKKLKEKDRARTAKAAVWDAHEGPAGIATTTVSAYPQHDVIDAATKTDAGHVYQIHQTWNQWIGITEENFQMCFTCSNDTKCQILNFFG